MKTCNKCKIEIKTNHTYCPLCHQVLTGNIDEDHVELYPKLEDQRIKVSKKLQQLVLFTSILSIFVLALIDVLDQGETFWSIIPIGAIVYFLLTIEFAVFTKTSKLGKIFGSTILLILLLYLINLRSNPDFLWSLDYTMPSLIIANNLTVLLYVVISKHGIRKHGAHLLHSFLIALVPILLYILDVIEDPLLPFTLFVLDIVSFFFMMIFFPRAFKDLIKRIFHL